MFEIVEWSVEEDFYSVTNVLRHYYI